MPFTLPLPSAVARADALEQVSPIILLAPRVSNSVGCPGVLIVASVCIRKEAFKYAKQVTLGKGARATQKEGSSLKFGQLFFGDMFIWGSDVTGIDLLKDGIPFVPAEREMCSFV